MEFESLYSGSSGNAYIVSDGKTRLLIEAGVTKKKLQKATGYNIPKHALVTHEHDDHSHAVKDLIKDGATVYMSYGTAIACGVEEVEVVEHGEQFTVGTLNIVPFSTFHDAEEPLGFLIKSKIDGDILVFAADTVNLNYRFPGVNILAIEANFDQAILDKKEKMHEKLKKRIANTHMEINVLCDYLRTLDLSQCREIYLIHMSDSNSHELHFVHKVERAVPGHIKVIACPKEVKRK